MGVTPMKTTIRVKCTGESVDFDTDSLPTVSTEFAFNYGLKQWVNDGAAKQRKDFDTDADYDEARVAGANDRIERLRSGDVPGTREPADPDTAASRRLAKTAKDAGASLAAVMADAKKAEKLLAYISKMAAEGRAA